EHATIGQPLELVRRFHELRTGQKITASHVTLGEQQYALILINDLGYDDALAFVTYGVKKARSADYAVSTLAGLKTYYPDFLQHHAAAERGREEATKRDEQRRQERAREAYAEYRRERAETLFDTASPEVREHIAAEALRRVRAGGSKFGNDADGPMFRFARVA